MATSKVFEIHTREGMLASTASKHKNPEAAVIELLDDAVAQANNTGASHVRIIAGVPTPLKVRRRWPALLRAWHEDEPASAASPRSRLRIREGPRDGSLCQAARCLEHRTRPRRTF